MLPPAVEHMSSYILEHLRSRSGTASPLLVGVQGPQGSGKTFLTSKLAEHLRETAKLRVCVLSLDDLYLPHAGLLAVAAAHPENALLRGRGLPGTHDVRLGSEILQALKGINTDDGHGGSEEVEVRVPVFDKSLHGGEGDRAGWRAVGRPLDVVVVEGWFLGFRPVADAEIERRYGERVPGLEEAFFEKRGYRVGDVREVNERLREYVAWWDILDVFVQIAPPPSTPYTPIYRWRLQQEHAMKARNGGRGMSDEQVRAFVDRYIPGYVFFGDGVEQSAKGRGQRITIGEEREVVAVDRL